MCSQANVLALGLALCMVQGAIGQGFNMRYDAFDQGNFQSAWGIEQAGNRWFIISAIFEPDTITPDSLIGITSIILETIDEQGSLLNEERHKVPEHAIFPGWADCCDTVAGGGYVSGGSMENFAGEIKVRLMRYAADGDTLWTRTFAESGHFMIGNQVKQTTDGGFLIVGWTGPTDYYDDHGFAIKTDSLGNEQWRHNYGPGGTVEAFSDIALLTDGYLLAGGTFPSVDNPDFLVTRTTLTGQELWSTRFGSPFREPNASIERLSDGRLLLFGAWAVDANGWEAPYIAELDPDDGQVMWERQYGLPNYGKTLFAAKELPNTDLIACGVTYEGGNQQGLLLRTRANGDSLWMRNYAFHDSVIDQGTGRFWDVLPTEDGGCIAAGVAYNPFGGPYPPGYSQDTWVVKVDSMGCIVPGCNGVVGITEVVTNLGGALHLYPNPVRDQLHVGIALPAKYTTHGPLTLTVTSMAGQVVLQKQVSTSVPEEVVLGVTSLASGLYSIHLSDATRWLAGKKFVVQ